MFCGKRPLEVSNAVSGMEAKHSGGIELHFGKLNSGLERASGMILRDARSASAAGAGLHFGIGWP
jgi:hypothetical protein